MANAKVSVIVPVYNVEDYLEECLESLERQTLKEIEVIIVNDGSTDKSQQIARRYSDKNNNFILIERENGGLGAARNTGMEYAAGKYVYFLDSDDYLIDTALEELYQRAEKEDLDVLKFSAYIFRDPSKELIWTGEADGGYRYKGEYLGIIEGRDFLNQLILNEETGFCSCCLIFIKKDMVERYHLRFCEGIIHEDELFHWQLISLSKRVEVLNKPLYCRRYREGSITQTPNWQNKVKSMYIITKSCEQFLAVYPELRGETSAWYVIKYIRLLMLYWSMLPSRLRYSLEVRGYIKQIKKIARKYKYGNRKDVWMFMFNIYLYDLYYRTAARIYQVFTTLSGRQGRNED